MAQVFWQDLYCSNCNKVTKHRHSFSGSIKDPFKDSNAKWECWACRTKGSISVRLAGHSLPENAFLTVFPSKKEPKTDVEKLQFVMDRIAEVSSYLDDRIAFLEKFYPETFFPSGKRPKRGILVKKE